MNAASPNATMPVINAPSSICMLTLACSAFAARHSAQPTP